MKTLIVVDMQNDFITGSLGSLDAQNIVHNVRKLVESFDGKVIFTRDTHNGDYLETQEGRKLPVEHCIKGTHGWEICDELKPYAKTIVDKITFGSTELYKYIDNPEDGIVICGLCTDICVISNAMILKAQFPDAPISVKESCCAGVSPESHNNAICAMKTVQLEII